MKTLRTIASCVTLAPLRDGTIALVPTMGALHDGHLALIAAAPPTPTSSLRACS